MLKILKKLIWCFIYLVLFFVGVFIGLIWNSVYQDSASRKFERELLRELSDKKALSADELPLEKQWRKVCIVPDYSSTLDVLEKVGYLDIERLDFVIGKPLHHTEEDRWQIVFITADNKVYAFYMLRLKVAADSLCAEYEQALFKMEKENTLSLVLTTD